MANEEEVLPNEKHQKEGTETPGPTVHINETCPADKTILRILLVSGHKTDMICNPSDSVTQLCSQVYDSWPQGTTI